MQLLNNLINVIRPDGAILSHGSIEDELLYHVDAMEEFMQKYDELNQTDDFYERIIYLIDNNNILFLNTSNLKNQEGYIFLPYEVTKEQLSTLENIDFSNVNINVSMNGIEYGITREFNIQNYNNKLR